MKLHHIGYLIKDIEKAIAGFNALGYQTVSLCEGEDIIFDAFRKCDICFMKNNRANGEEPLVELVSPVSQESPVYSLLKTYKNTPYHLCFECDHIENKAEELKALGWMLFQPMAPAPAIRNKNVAFFMHRNAGIIELVEKERV